MKTLCALLIAFSAVASGVADARTYNVDILSYLELARELGDAEIDPDEFSLTFPVVMVFDESGAMTGHSVGVFQDVLAESLEEGSSHHDASVELDSVLALLSRRPKRFEGYTIVQVVMSSKSGVCPPCDSQHNRIESFIESRSEPVRLLRLSVGMDRSRRG